MTFARNENIFSGKKIFNYIASRCSKQQDCRKTSIRNTIVLYISTKHTEYYWNERIKAFFISYNSVRE